MYHFYIRTSGEIFIKSRATRKHILKKLQKNIKAALFQWATLNNRDLKYTLNKDNFHYELECSEDVAEILEHIPGISSFSPVHIIETKDFDYMLDKATSFFSPKLSGKKFAVRSKSKLKDFKNNDIAVQLGQSLFEYSEGVNLKHPDITCQINVRPENTIFYSEVIKGPEGFPVDISGRTLTLFSGGIDSPIAAWKIYKNGVGQDYIFFDLGGESQKEGALNLVQHIHRKFAAGSKSTILIIPFQDIMAALLKIKSPYQNLGLKVCFYKAAEKIAAKINIDSIVTGESLGQVSTQTLSNLSSLNRITNIPVFRPLLCDTKTEIIHKAQALKIFDMTYQGTELCALSLKNVRTESKPENILKEMLNFDWSLIDSAVEKVWGIPLHRPEHWTYFAQNKPTIVLDPKLQIIQIDDTLEHTVQKGKILYTNFKLAQQQCLDWNKDIPYHIICPLGQKSYYIKQLMTENGYQVEAFDEKEYTKTMFVSN